MLGHISSNIHQVLSDVISAMGSQWCQPQGVFDDAGKPILKPDGKQFYTYELHQAVLNASATPSQQSKALIYSDESLKGTRWKLLPGVSVLDMNTQAPRLRAARRRRRLPRGHPGRRSELRRLGDGEQRRQERGNFIIDLTITNSYIRHTSVFVSFLKADGVTPMTVTDTGWLALLARQPLLAPRQ